MAGRSKAEGGEQESNEEDEGRRVGKDVMNAALTADLVESHHKRAPAGEGEEVGDVERGSSSVLAEEPFQHVKQSWDCSQVENEPEERYAMDWLMNDESMKRW